MNTAADRLSALDDLPGIELCGRAGVILDSLVSVMNEETTLLRAGRFRDAASLTADKTQLAQDYVALARTIQRQTPRLLQEAPEAVQLLRDRHERLATQMAENLRVIATARSVTEDLLTDVARAVGGAERSRTYGATGELPTGSTHAARGIAINRSL